MNFYTTVFQPFRDFFFSRTCFHCKQELLGDEERLCNSCWSSLNEVHSNDFTYKTMAERFHSEGIIDGFFSLYYFEKHGVFQTLAHNLKYEEVREFGKILGRKLAAKIQSENVAIDAIIPVPLNKQKFRERGYNQAEIIAQEISSILNIPTESNLIQRIKYTQTQTKLNAEQRKENVENAFVVVLPEKIKNKNFLIIDDVITTGATIQEIAKILKNSGAKKTFIASAGLAKLGEDN